MKNQKFNSCLLALIGALILVLASITPTQAGRLVSKHSNDVETSSQLNGTPEPEERPRVVPELHTLPAESLDSSLSVGAIVTNITPVALAQAMGIPAVNIVSASFNGSDPLAFGVGQTPLGFHFPTSGSSFAILSTGWAQAAEWPNSQPNLSFTLGGLNNSQGNDLVQLDVRLIVPANANCASFDFAFYSEEFPEYVGSQYNDTFTAELGGTSFIISGTQVIAPLNFAFDIANKIISVNTVSGVSAPTNTTYDGKTPLRRAKTPVAPGQQQRFVFSIQDLGDSFYDSAVFLDNFAFTYDPACNPGVKPPVTPQGNLQLHMPGDIATGSSVRPAVTVLNQSNSPVSYNVIIQLWRGIAMRDQRVIPIQFISTGSQRVSVDFGIYGPDKYYIRAELWQGQERLQSEQQIFFVGYPYLKLKSAASDLTAAAQMELNESREIVVDAMTSATLAFARKTIEQVIDALVGKVLVKIPEFADIFGTDTEKMGAAINQLASRVSGLKEAIEMADPSSVETFHRNTLDKNTFTARQMSVQSEEANLLNFAEGKNFNWSNAWQADVAHFKTCIADKNETDRSGLGLHHVDFTPPYIHLVTLTEMKGNHDFLMDKAIPVLDKWGEWILYGLAAVLLAAVIIILIAGTGATGGIALLGIAKIVAWLIPVFQSAFALSAKAQVFAVILAMLSGFGISFTAEVRVSPHIVDEHRRAMSEMKKWVGGNATAINADVDVATNVRGQSVDLQTSVSTTDGVALASTQLFRADGSCIKIAPYREVQHNQKANQTWTLQPGAYWMVGVAHSSKGVVAKRASFTVTNPQVELSLFLNKTGFALGEMVKATVLVRNLNASQSTGALLLGVGTLDGEGLQLWTPSLDAGQSATYEYVGFVPQREGGYVLRASIGNESGSIARIDRAFAVGNAAAVQLNISPQTVYPPGNAVIWNVAALNAGNQPTTTIVTFSTYDLNNRYALVSTSSYTLMLNAQVPEALSVPVLQPAQPGSYSTHIEMNGRIYRTDNYLVAADGALFAVVQAEPTVVTLGQQAVITVEVQNEVYSPIDADVTLTLSSPDGQLLNPPLQQVAAGIYQAAYTPSISGTFQVDVSVTKPNYAGNKGRAFIISQDASLLLTDVEGQLTLEETAAMTLTVQNERGKPVQNATVVVSDTQGVLVVFTDSNGKAMFTIKATDTTPRTARVEKVGFATTSLQLPVKDSPGSNAPNLVLSAPSITNQSPLTVFGLTDSGTNVSVQGQPVAVSSSGSFSAVVQLVEGANSVSVLATNVTGLSTALTKTVTLDLTPPLLAISTPPPSHVTTTPIVTFAGQVEPGAALIVDGRTVNVQPDGSYSIAVVLGVGKNIITLTAIDAAGNEQVEQRLVTRLSMNYLPLIRRE